MAKARLKRPAQLAALVLLAACSGAAERRPLVVSEIGERISLIDDAMKQGLVRLHPTRGIEPALAERWIVIDDGKSYVFRLKEANWANGRSVTAAEVVASLRRSLIARSELLAPMLDNIASVVPMTGRVIEIRLKQPQPLFLHFLAQPDAAITKAGVGTGPYAVHSQRNGITRLRPVQAPGMALLEEDDSQDGSQDIRFRNEAAATAVARFVAGHSDVVTGGTLADLPIAQAAQPANSAWRIEVTPGLFGLTVADPRGPLANKALRRALSLALVRETLASRLRVPQLRIATAGVPGGTSISDGVDLTSTQQARLAKAQELVAGRTLEISVSLPPGPGMDRLFAALRADWSYIGVDLKRAAPRSRPDLALIDEVARVNSLAWYTSRLGCRNMLVCDPDSDSFLEAAMRAAQADTRQILLVRASSVIEESATYIPIAQPLRWSLVGPQATAWRSSPIAYHPLIDLR